jgi:hypothetical protein
MKIRKGDKEIYILLNHIRNDWEKRIGFDIHMEGNYPINAFCPKDVY